MWAAYTNTFPDTWLCITSLRILIWITLKCYLSSLYCFPIWKKIPAQLCKAPWALQMKSSDSGWPGLLRGFKYYLWRVPASPLPRSCDRNQLTMSNIKSSLLAGWDCKVLGITFCWKALQQWGYSLLVALFWKEVGEEAAQEGVKEET